MKVIFLDIDGVLNSHHWFKKYYDKNNPDETYINFSCIQNLAKIVKATDAKIVLSASCRREVKSNKNHFLRKIFERYDLEIYDFTPHTGLERGVDIQEWLNHHLDVTNIVIIDDDSDMKPLMKYLVQTKWLVDDRYKPLAEEGLNRKIAKQAIEMLDKPFENKMINQVKNNFRKSF